MVYYVSAQRARDEAELHRLARMTNELQVDDMNNAFLSPDLLFAHFGEGEATEKQLRELYFDLLQLCDGVVVVTQADAWVRADIEMARRLNMEVYHVEA